MEHTRLFTRSSGCTPGVILYRLRGALFFASILLLGGCATAGNPPVVDIGSSDTKALRQAIEDVSGRSKTGSYDDAPITDKLTRLIAKYDPEAAILLQRVEVLPAESSEGERRVVISSADAAKYPGLNLGQYVAGSAPRGYRRWLRAVALQDSLGEMGEVDTALHEQNHVYQNRWAQFIRSQLVAKGNAEAIRFNQREDLVFAAYFFGRQRTDILQEFRLTPIRELGARIPVALRTFRFPVYVSGEGVGQYHASQKYGIYGLLSEYSSYYWDQRLRLDLFPWFVQQTDQSALHWLEVVSWTGRTMPAFAEFRYFILEYLAMEKELHPDEYRKIMDDQDLRRTFTDLDDAYITLIKDVVAFASTTLPRTLEKKGIKVAWEHPRILGTWTKAYDYSFWIEADKIISGAVWKWNDYYILGKELRTERLRRIADEFRLHPAAELPPLELPLPKARDWIPKVKGES